MNATVGVAIATLLVVGGILAGPSILECSRDSNGFGACLRDKVADSGLIAPDTEQATHTEVVADVSSEEAVPAGWMEANANEYEPPVSVPVDLSGTSADLAAAELEPASEAPVEVAVVPPVELATAALAPIAEPGAVTLDGAELGLVAEGASSSEAEAPAEVALVAPQGEVTAMSPLPEQPAGDAAALIEADELIAEGTETEDAVTEVTPEPAPVELQAEASVEPIPAPPAAALEYNPEYPNVLVLPPPVAGDDSSFRSLQLN